MNTKGLAGSASPFRLGETFEHDCRANSLNIFESAWLIKEVNGIAPRYLQPIKPD